MEVVQHFSNLRFGTLALQAHVWTIVARIEVYGAAFIDKIRHQLALVFAAPARAQ